MGNVTGSMKLHILKGRRANGYTTFGGYWPKGAVAKGSEFALQKADGTGLPVQSRVSAYWPDGSLKWTAHVADASLMGDEVILSASDGEGNGGAAVDASTGAGASARQALHDEAKALSPEMLKNLSILVLEEPNIFHVDAGGTELDICKNGEAAIRNIRWNGSVSVTDLVPELILESREKTEDGLLRRERHFTGHIDGAELLTNGELSCSFRIRGTHVSGEETALPFLLYVDIFRSLPGKNSRPEIRLTHTFFFDRDEKKDFLKGIGLAVHSPIQGANVNRHIRMLTDHGSFHEAALLLTSWRPRVDPELYKKSMAGQFLHLDPEKDATALQAAGDIPVWGEYVLHQASDTGFLIQKKIGDEGVCYIDALRGNRAKGVVAYGGENGGMILGMRDFWQKYPAAIQVEGLDRLNAVSHLWFYSPFGEAFDFRHYARRGYSQSYYEGFDTFGATAFGIAVTSECTLAGYRGEIPSEEVLQEFEGELNKEAIYVADPEYYHQHHAFGRWSLPAAGSGAEGAPEASESSDQRPVATELEKRIEEVLDGFADYYLQEREVRHWYGLFDYGDVMHTYDPARHVWKYDMGGYAWQNTELMPTMWLWYGFLRTGSEKLFSMAEAMTRHCSEVDVYHMGPLQGLGTRHNVRHWGCPCKEARIAMAAHHRFYYYLTGDWRIRDIFEEVKDADQALIGMDPLRYFFDPAKMVYPTHARSGPDWSSFCSNWMTMWELTGDRKYIDKMMVGIADLKKMPLKLISGTDYEYDPATGHLRYIGENASGGTHLQICQGGSEVWMELTELLDDPEWTDMVANLGRMYPKPHDELVELTNGLIRNREFTYPFMAGALMGFAADLDGDHELGRKVFDIMWEVLPHIVGESRRTDRVMLKDTANQAEYGEIPQLTTNEVAQWGLNMIVAMEFVRRDWPGDVK